MSDLNDFIKLMAEAKAKDPKHQKIKAIKETVKEDVNDFFKQLSAVSPKQIVIEEEKIDELVEKIEIIEEAEQEVLKEEIPEITPEEDKQAEVLKLLKKQPEAVPFSQPQPDVVAKDLKVITDKIKFMEQWLGKIAATGPGSGEVNLRYLDDVARETISDGRYLKYNGTSKKFEFDDINPYEVVHNTTLVDEPTYAVTDSDYYIGVNYAGAVTITLPTSPNSGRIIIIKDESGNASINPITVVGNVDNDPGGFILQMDNGGTQMIYRAGWRII